MNSIVKDKSFEFALDIIKLYVKLKDANEFVISKQILRSGTSIGANIKEGMYAQSKADFLSKMYISYKEAQETEYWLELLESSQLVKVDLRMYLEKVREINRILSSITKTTKNSLSKKSASS